MDWFDIDEILYDGTKEEIGKIKCPDCGGAIEFTYFKGRFEKKCQKCGAFEIEHSEQIPNCVTFYGKSRVLN